MLCFGFFFFFWGVVCWKVNNEKFSIPLLYSFYSMPRIPTTSQRLRSQLPLIHKENPLASKNRTVWKLEGHAPHPKERKDGTRMRRETRKGTRSVTISSNHLRIPDYPKSPSRSRGSPSVLPNPVKVNHQPAGNNPSRPVWSLQNHPVWNLQSKQAMSQ